MIMLRGIRWRSSSNSSRSTSGPPTAASLARSLAAYLLSTAASLVFLTVSQTADAAKGGPVAAVGSSKSACMPPSQAAGGAAAGAAAAGGSSSSMASLGSMVEGLLQTQLGVFVFSNCVLATCATVAAITTAVFLESLTPLEAGRLTQRLLKYLLFKVALVGMVVLPSSKVALLHWLPWLAFIGEVKMFVGLAKDRLAGLAVTPAVGVRRHARTLGLLLAVLAANLAGVLLLRRQRGALSWTVSLLFGLDLSIVSVEALKAALSCVSLLLDEALTTAPPSLELSRSLSARAVLLWEAWQHNRGREAFFYQTELAADMAVHVLTLLHHGAVWLLHGLSFHLLDALLLLDTRAVVLSFLKRVRAHRLHNAATHNLDGAFPDAAPKQLDGDADCAICRDRLSAAKLLPCGHLFHLACLRAWLQQSGMHFRCPICRLSLSLPAQRPAAAAPAARGGGGRQLQPAAAPATAAAGGGGLLRAHQGGATTPAAGSAHADPQQQQHQHLLHHHQQHQQQHAILQQHHQQQHPWGMPPAPRRRQAAPGLLSFLSLSMSYEDLTALAHRRGGGGTHDTSSDDDAALLPHDEALALQQLLAAAGGEDEAAGGGGRHTAAAAPAGEGAAALLLGDAEGADYDALLAHAIAASLETAAARRQDDGDGGRGGADDAAADSGGDGGPVGAATNDATGSTQAAASQQQQQQQPVVAQDPVEAAAGPSDVADGRRHAAAAIATTSVRDQQAAEQQPKQEKQQQAQLRHRNTQGRSSSSRAAARGGGGGSDAGAVIDQCVAIEGAAPGAGAGTAAAPGVEPASRSGSSQQQQQPGVVRRGRVHTACTRLLATVALGRRRSSSRSSGGAAGEQE